VPEQVITEPLGDGMSRQWRVDETLVDTQTEYQHLVIARTAQGISLFCDDERQSTEVSQLLYHEALLVPALLLAEQVRDVLVIGSSEGVVCQIAVDAGARRVDHVDIDQQAVELCAEHLPYGYSPAELKAAVQGDGPVRVHYGDGLAYVDAALANGTRYDIVLVDLPDERDDDPQAQHNRLYGKDFLAQCRALLTDGGVVVGQAGCPTLWRNMTLKRCWRRFTDTFPTVGYFGSDEHEWAFLTGVTRELVPLTTQLARLAGLTYRPQWIDAAALRAARIPPLSVRTDA
jgi:spermidine synthase